MTMRESKGRGPTPSDRSAEQRVRDLLSVLEQQIRQIWRFLGSIAADNPWLRQYPPSADEPRPVVALFADWLRRQEKVVRDFLGLVFFTLLPVADAFSWISEAHFSAVVRERGPEGREHVLCVLHRKVTRALNAFRRMVVEWSRGRG